jgi:hypothetical protein
MNYKEMEKYIQKMNKERLSIQKKIQNLNQKRDQYIQNTQREETEEKSLDQAIIAVIKDQGSKKGFN